MYIAQIIAAVVFVLGYATITLEHKTKISKSAIALVTGGLLWMLVSLSGVDFHAEIAEAGSEIFGIVIFLLSAMSLVEILLHYKFFYVLRGKLYALGLSERHQFVVVYFMTFFLSAAIDNLTTTIIMIQIARKFFKGDNLILAGAAIVIAANAGGAFSPIGDVTTIMLWLAGKFDTFEIILKAFLPSLAFAVTTLALMYPRIKNSDYDAENEIITKLSRSERLIVGLIFASFLLPLVMNFFRLPPYIGLLLGLGVVWIVVDIFKKIRPHHHTHLNASIEKFIKQTDISSLKFFVGILLAVSALNSLHILEYVSQVLYGFNPSDVRVIMGNIGLGFLSAIVDNVPLTAIAIQMLETTPSLWILLAITVGTGGSLLVIGSAAGVVAMGMAEGLNFERYFNVAFIPALAGYVAAIVVWSVQYFIFGF